MRCVITVDPVLSHSPRQLLLHLPGEVLFITELVGEHDLPLLLLRPVPVVIVVNRE